MSQTSCLFCKIVEGNLPAQKVYEDEFVVGFRDLFPQAKIHILFIHKNHSNNMNHLVDTPADLVQIFNAIKYYTVQEGLEQSGFRIVTNTGPDAGQTVFHTHVHILAGEKLGTFGK